MHILSISPVVSKGYQLRNNNISFESRFPNGEKRPQHQKELYAYRDFARYNPVVKDFGGYKIPVHNEEIARRLKPTYSSDEFKGLFEFTKKKGTFDFMMDKKTGLIKTSMINRKENELMSDMIWITDSCHNMELVKKKHPEDCVKVLNKLADLYDGQQKNFDYTIENPSKYKSNGFFGGATQVGVGHCFIPSTKQEHPWFAKTRLESVGNYLQTSVDIIEGGFKGEEYGYKSVDEIPDTVVNSISNCTKYLKAINYPTARSCGAWEEQTFVNSLTSDTSIVNQGMRDVMRMMYSPTDDANMLALRERILNSKNGDVFEDKKSLENLLKAGEQRIVDLPYMETEKGGYSKPLSAAWEVKCLSRKEDSAMSFMPQTETLDPENIEHDAAKKLLVMKKLEKALVRPNGAIRYQGDEYLNLDYHNIKDKWADNKKTNEAEWFLVSEFASGYGAIASGLMDHIEATGEVTPKTKRLLDIALKGETEHINRSYARITPRNMTKSNGYTCPAYKLPEAYEAVTTKNGKVKFVPGAHNPLTWAESSLFSASEQYLSNLERYENLDL